MLALLGSGREEEGPREWGLSQGFICKTFTPSVFCKISLLSTVCVCDSGSLVQRPSLLLSLEEKRPLFCQDWGGQSIGCMALGWESECLLLLSQVSQQSSWG